MRKDKIVLPQNIDKPIFFVWGCMKGLRPLHIQSAEPALRFKVGSPKGFQVGFADRDGKIGDFDAAPLERPKWPLPLSFFFSPRAAFHLPGVPALRSAKALSSGLQPRKRGLRPAVTEGDKRREGFSPTSDGE